MQGVTRLALTSSFAECWERFFLIFSVIHRMFFYHWASIFSFNSMSVIVWKTFKKLSLVGGVVTYMQPHDPCPVEAKTEELHREFRSALTAKQGLCQKLKTSEAGGTAKWLRVLPEGPGSIPSIHVTAHSQSPLSPVLGDLVPSSVLRGHCTHVQTDAQRKHSSA